ncbi:MAG: PSD1 and planctomycete cytochrome C domain-containing protein, partial [Gemmataceae bacterium]
MFPLLALFMVAPPEAPIDFNREIRPILSQKCFRCHGPDEGERKADLRLDTFEGATADLGDSRGVVPGDPAKSAILDRVRTTEKGKLMPPKSAGTPLTTAEIERLERWIRQGAKYATHWSHVAPVRPAVPAGSAHPIDAFLRKAQQTRGIEFQPEADRLTLARRLALDLTGLPPTAKEREEYLADKSTNATEKYVARLLAKPAYGEHWARAWLDIARYADSAGYADDPARTIWKYRDWVIAAYNSNQPFDQFTIEQIAGDLLPKPTNDQLVATAFHRNTLTNNEGGTSDEEFRNVAVVDRVNTTLTAWMGTSAACAQCHTHKYDPLTQKEYFELFAFFNSSADHDQRDERPLLEFFTPDQVKKRAALQATIAEIEKSLAGKKPEEMKPERESLAAKKKELKGIHPSTSVPIMKELPAKQNRKTRIQLRGNYQELGDEVQPGTPAVFPPLDAKAPRDRLALARWLVDPKNPLTARVAVNRVWEQLFGIGIVRTAEEFGSQGDLPTHPELLDWIATEYIRLGWDSQKLLTLIVTSRAYLQQSHTTLALSEKDPENLYHSRGPRVRLSAEMVRDQALAVSGLLSSKMFGPPVKPPQPALGLSAAFGSSVDWTPSTGEDRYRRGVYTEWRRTNPYATMATFDAPNRDVCTVRRSRTNTPLQALVTLNDAVYLEAAQELARQMLLQHPQGPSAQIAASLFEKVLGRPAKAAEVRRLTKLYDEVAQSYKTRLPEATKLATEP